MKVVEVEAVEDRSRVEGGHAVIVLRGVERLPEHVEFTLRLAASDPNDADAPTVDFKDLSPLEARLTADGLALVVGPEITENPAFFPGAVVELSMTVAGLAGEFRWPSVAPLARPKRRNIMLRRATEQPLPLHPPPHIPGDPNKTGAIGQLEPVAAQDLRVEPLPTADTSAAALPQAVASGSRRPVVITSSVMRAERQVQSELGEITKQQGQPAQSQRVVQEAATIEAASPAPSEAPSTAVGTVQEGPLSGSDPTKVETPPRPAFSPNSDSADISVNEPAHPTATTRTSRREMSSASAAALAVAIVVGGQIIALRALDLGIARRSPAEVVAAQPVVQEPAAPDVVPRSIFAVFGAGPRSPRGVVGADVSPAKALQLAHGLLNGPEGSRDPEEAIYWLKRYVAGAAGVDHARIALTQMGSAYIQLIGGQRDFASARMVWELASALGDPVATCFLGTMHEQGLGLQADSRAAAVWYERATALGRGCAQTSPAQGGETR